MELEQAKKRVKELRAIIESTIFTTWYIITVEYTIDRERHMYILIDVRDRKSVV